MAIRTKSQVDFQIGQDGSLDDCLFSRNFTELLDTLDHASSGVLTMAAGETGTPIPFGDVAEGRIVYLEADGEIDVAFGGVAPTGAVVTGVGGSFPTGFAGGEAMTIDIDNLGSVVVAFTAAASLVQDVANEINAAFALAGILSGGLPVAPASVSGGEVRLTSPSTGITSEVDIVAIDAGVATALGLAAGVTNGTNATPGTTDISLERAADPAGASAAVGVLAYLLATINTTSITLDNLSTNTVRVKYAIAGDLVSS